MTDTLLERADELDASEDVSAETIWHANAGLIAQLKAEHKFIRYWHIRGFGLVVVRRLRRAEVLTFSKLANVAGKKHDADGDSAALIDASEKTVTTCCVWPKERERLKEVFDEYPGFASTATAAIWKMQDEGITEGVTEGKE
jgi:hypothetical protein